MAIALFLILWVLNLVHSLCHWVDESAFTGDENDGSSVMQHHLVAVECDSLDGCAASNLIFILTFLLSFVVYFDDTFSHSLCTLIGD